MNSFSPNRSRRIAAVASALTVCAVAAVVAVLVLGLGGPDSWWPQTGQAFASDTATAHNPSRCGLVGGPAKAYCARDRNHDDGAASASATGNGRVVWQLIPAAAAVGALVILGCRRPTSTDDSRPSVARQSPAGRGRG